jgi:hypothetical protein
MDNGGARAEPAPASSRETEARTSASLSAAGLIGSAVVLGRIRQGVVRDTLLGADLGVVLGFVVETPMGRRCFLPWAGAQLVDGIVRVATPSLLLGEVELDYYVGSGVRLLDLTEGDVELDYPAGVVHDVTVRPDGSTDELVLATPGGPSRTVPVDDIRVRWSAGAASELSTATSRRRRWRIHGHRGLALETGPGRSA